MGLAEVYANIVIIREMLDTGYTVKNVYDSLRTDDRVSISLKRFYQLLRGLNIRVKYLSEVQLFDYKKTRRKKREEEKPKESEQTGKEVVVEQQGIGILRQYRNQKIRQQTYFDILDDYEDGD